MNKTIVVLGMHRSGTSLVAGVLHHLGVNMGKEMLGGDRFNPFGHFENKKIIKLNEEILKEAGGSWYAPPSSEKILKVREKFKNKIKEIIESEKSKLWGFKDPRTSLTIELFLPFLENPYFIVCYRNKREIIKSLIRRDKMNFEYASRLIDLYYERITKFFEAHRDLRRINVKYEEMMRKPRVVLEKIICFLDIQVTEDAVKKALSFVHSRFEVKIAKILCRIKGFFERITKI